MFTLTFLGTSASVPSAERNHPGLLVDAGNQRVLVDCGEGTQRQLLRAGAGFRRLDRLLLTHGHLDHALGIPGLFSTLRLRRSADLMTIHGSADTLDVVIRMLAGLWGEGKAPIPLEFVPLTAGQVIDAGEFTIGCFPVRHRNTDSFAFSFESRARRHLRPDRLEAFGVPDGPVRKELAEGRSVTLSDGRTIEPEDVFGPPEGGKKLVIVGDAETTEGLAEQVRDADVLVIEATSSIGTRPSRATTDISPQRKRQRWRPKAASNNWSSLTSPDVIRMRTYWRRRGRRFRTAGSQWISITS